MCKSTEAVITGVYHSDSDTWSLWLTEAVAESQFEIVAFSDGDQLDLVELFLGLRDALTFRSTFGVAKGAGGISNPQTGRSTQTDTQTES